MEKLIYLKENSDFFVSFVKYVWKSILCYKILIVWNDKVLSGFIFHNIEKCTMFVTISEITNRQCEHLGYTPRCTCIFTAPSCKM